MSAHQKSYARLLLLMVFRDTASREDVHLLLDESKLFCVCCAVLLSLLF